MKYPKGAIDTAISTLEAVRVDYAEGDAILRAIDDSLDRLYRVRELGEGVAHPYRRPAGPKEDGDG